MGIEAVKDAVAAQRERLRRWWRPMVIAAAVDVDAFVLHDEAALRMTVEDDLRHRLESTPLPWGWRYDKATLALRNAARVVRGRPPVEVRDDVLLSVSRNIERNTYTLIAECRHRRVVRGPRTHGRAYPEEVDRPWVPHRSG